MKVYAKKGKRVIAMGAVQWDLLGKDHEGWEKISEDEFKILTAKPGTGPKVEPPEVQQLNAQKQFEAEEKAKREAEEKAKEEAAASEKLKAEAAAADAARHEAEKREELEREEKARLAAEELAKKQEEAKAALKEKVDHANQKTEAAKTAAAANNTSSKPKNSPNKK